MTFFNKVIANESKNRMSIWNISTIMAPNLFFSRSKHSDCEELLLANTAAHIIRLMLKYQEILWKVSNSVVPASPVSTSTQGAWRLVSRPRPVCGIFIRSSGLYIGVLIEFSNLYKVRTTVPGPWFQGTEWPGVTTTEDRLHPGCVTQVFAF